MKVVLDTNVFVSAILVPQSPPAELLLLALKGNFRLALSPQIMAETLRVLRYPKLARLLERRGLTLEEVEALLRKVWQSAILTPGVLTVSAFPADPADDMVLACALEAEADVIVSGDRHLTDLGVYEGIQIVNPATFLKLMQRPEEE
jgi:putative PIN family toxin of toxin-antitoxin system